MKYFISFILTLLLAGCNLFQGKQPAGESVAVEEKQEGNVCARAEGVVCDKSYN